MAIHMQNLIDIPINQLLPLLQSMPGYMGEAVAKAAYQAITNKPGHAHHIACHHKAAAKEVH